MNGKPEVTPTESSEMTQPTSEHELIEQKWDKIRGQVRARWPKLTADELNLIDGDPQKLIALVHQKTGDHLSEIEDAIDAIAESSEGMMARVRKQVQAANEVAAERIATASQQARSHVVSRPTASLSIAFGLGLALGVCVTGLRLTSSADR